MKKSKFKIPIGSLVLVPGIGAIGYLTNTNYGMGDIKLIKGLEYGGVKRKTGSFITVFLKEVIPAEIVLK